jgi:hypothetical protein
MSSAAPNGAPACSLQGGPRHGERITIAGLDSGEPPPVIEVPDRVAPDRRDGPPPGRSRYRLAGHDSRRNAYLYTYLSPLGSAARIEPKPRRPGRMILFGRGSCGTSHRSDPTLLSGPDRCPGLRRLARRGFGESRRATLV